MRSLMSTYSIAAYDTFFQEWGVGVQSKFLASGSLVPWVKPEVGAVATQARTNAGYGKRALALLEAGCGAEAVIQRMLEEDENQQVRQMGIVDASGGAYAFTGEQCLPYAGHRVETSYTCQGNLLVGEDVLHRMAVSFQDKEGDLADKILAALKGAQKAGGDRRGVQSAALLVKKPKEGMFGFHDIYIDLRVDDHPAPLQELERLKSLHRVSYLPTHQDKYFAFDEVVRTKIMFILQEIGEVKGCLKQGDTLEKALENFGSKHNLSASEIFQGNLINGQLVDKVAQAHYGHLQKRYG